MEFIEKFNSYSNIDLLKIIDNLDDYQTTAVEAAKSLLSERQLTEDEINIAKDEIEFEKQEKLKQTLKKREIENKIKNIGISIIDNVNPIQKHVLTTDKTIKIISLLFGGVFLFQLYNELDLIIFLFTESSGGWDFTMVLYFLPLVILFTATILFYKKKKYGWFLLTIFLTYSSVLALWLFIKTINRGPSVFSTFDNIFPQTSATTYVLTFAFFAVTIWTICRENIRIVYSISKQTMALTIATLIVGLGLNLFF